jgi:hypothetical protein
MHAKHIKGTISLCAALLAGVALVAASGAGAAKAPRTAQIDVSTKAAVVHYLRAIHVNPTGVVIQRSAHNYAGPNCPGKRWTCASTARTVVQVAGPRGKNIFRCTTARCAVVQISKSALATNLASCIKTTGVTQSCSISQPNSVGTNKAVVWMDTGKLTGLTQTALYTASISQGPASASGAANINFACVHQLISIDGSTVNTKSSGTTVTNEAHQSISIAQNSQTGANTVENAKATGTGKSTTYDCDTSALSQDQTLTSTATSKGAVVQRQNAADSGPNLTLDIEQNQGSAFLNNVSVTGRNKVSFKQTNTLTAIANAPGATQIQGSPSGGILAAVNEYSYGTDASSGLSTADAVQVETQCEDAQRSGLTTCETNDPDAPTGGYPLTQTQYGPAGLVQTANSRHARRFESLRKAPGDSSVTGNPADTVSVKQTSNQDNDTKSGQSNVIAGGITTDGTGNVTQNTLIQGTPKKNVHEGEDTTVTGNMNCGGSACTKNLSPPTINSKPPNPDTFGHAASFSFSNPDDTVVFVCALDPASDADYVPCTSPTSYPTPVSGSHTFSVKTKDPDNGNLSAAASYSWVITPPDPSITAKPSDPSTSTSPSFSFNDADSSVSFECQIDGGGYTGCTSPQNYTLSAGPHTFDVKAVSGDATAKSGATSYTWTIQYIVFDGSPGTGAPPSTLGPYSMTAFGADSQAVCTYSGSATTAMTTSVSDPAGTIGFDQALNHDHIGSLPPECWQTWSNGYTGDVYDTLYSLSKTQATITLPVGTNAFYFYAEPNAFSILHVTATAQDGTTSTPVAVNGNGGATYLGFYQLGGATLSSITVMTDDTSGFAVGEFGIAVAGP